ncbi:FMN-binding negative transcriptional regulator [Spirosoma koreense]
MYIPKQFRNPDQESIRDFIRQYSFGLLINQIDNRPYATHIPLELDTNANGEDVLLGHIARGNPQWKSFSETDEVLAIFQGPHAYISSSWYDHENVPTWNYQAVHAYCSVRIIDGEELLNSLRKLVARYEQASVNPVSVDTMSEGFLRAELRGIVGVELTIRQLQAVDKLSQNRDDKNHQAIIQELTQQTDPQAQAVAVAMQKGRCPIHPANS